jgi:hypothetical protein
MDSSCLDSGWFDRNSGSGLPAFGSEEQDPDREVVAELLEAMLHSSGYEQKIAGLEPLARFAIGEDAASRNDGIDFIAR